MRNLNGGCPPCALPGRQTQITVVCVMAEVYGRELDSVNPKLTFAGMPMDIAGKLSV